MQALRISGPDAKDFLHRVTSANFKNLESSQFVEGCLLQPNGKIIIYFKAFCKSAEDYILLNLSESAKVSHEAFEKIHFRENLKIEEIKAPMDISKDAPHETLSEEQRILAGIPKAPNEINQNFNPLEVGLQRAVHENKGCYPGQEVIERIRSMGQVPRRLVIISGTGLAPNVGTIIKCDGKDAGEITSSTNLSQKPNQWAGLGIVKKIFLESSSFQISSPNSLQSVHLKIVE